jgi:hypothetical protein
MLFALFASHKDNYAHITFHLTLQQASDAAASLAPGFTSFSIIPWTSYQA